MRGAAGARLYGADDANCGPIYKLDRSFNNYLRMRPFPPNIGIRYSKTRAQADGAQMRRRRLAEIQRHVLRVPTTISQLLR